MIIFLVTYKLKAESPIQKYAKLYKLIEDVYNCEEISEIDLSFDTGYPVDLILKVAKWFFLLNKIYAIGIIPGRAMFHVWAPKTLIIFTKTSVILPLPSAFALIWRGSKNFLNFVICI